MEFKKSDEDLYTDFRNQYRSPLKEGANYYIIPLDWFLAWQQHVINKTKIFENLTTSSSSSSSSSTPALSLILNNISTLVPSSTPSLPPLDASTIADPSNPKLLRMGLVSKPNIYFFSTYITTVNFFFGARTF